MPYKDKAKHREAARRWWRKTSKKRKKHAPYKRVGQVIDETNRCLHHAARADYCRRKARWRCGQWRVCDEHYREHTGLVLIEQRRTGEDEP